MKHPYIIAFNTLLIREVLRFMRIWVQTIFPPVITTALYFIIFGTLIGEKIGAMNGYEYRSFIVPGLILMAIITQSYANAVSSFYQSKYQKHVEELLVAPVPNGVILAGYVAGGIARGMVVGLAVSLVAAFFVDFEVAHWGLSLLVAVLTAALFATAGFINAIFANSFDDIALIPTFILTPLTYLGGVFYSIELLPEFWQKISLFNPLLYMINTFRYGLLGGGHDINPIWAIVLILVFISLLVSWALWLLRRGTGIKT